MANTFQIEIPNRDIGQNKNIAPKVVVKSLTPTEMDWAGFERHLMSGQPYSFNNVALKKGRRRADEFLSASHIAMDSDKNATLAEILNPANSLAKHIRYVAPSPSDTSTYRKLRVIFPLAQSIYDKSFLRSTQKLLYEEFLRFGVRFDPACLDPCRWYYAKETDEIADFDLNLHSIPSADYCGILRLPNAVPLDEGTLTDLAGELEPQRTTPTIHITDLDTLANLLENELRQAGVLLERRDGVNEKVFCTLKLTHCHTSVEHEEKDNKQGAYSHANITVWKDGGLTYHCYGGTCANKSIYHFLRKFNISNKALKTALEGSTRKSHYTPQLLVPEKYPNQKVVNQRYLSDAIKIQEIDERMVVLDSALGTGKTECLKNYVQFCSESGFNVIKLRKNCECMV